MSKNEQHLLKYNPRLDGLRAIAVISVLLGHVGFAWIKEGAYGVDIFFVLSGYLITTVLFKALRERLPLSIFYMRRFLRLSPALFFLCFCFLVAARPLGIYFPTARNDVVASVCNIANWARVFHTGVPMYLGHAWSLSIEEQFYLIWPLLMIGAMALGGRRFLLMTILVLIAIILVIQSQLLIPLDADRIYNSLETRSGALLAGCFLSVLENREQPQNFLDMVAFKARWISLVPFAVLIFLAHTQGWGIITSWIVVGLTCLTIVLISDSSCSPILNRILSWRPMVEIGKRSYAIYLWHYPIIIALTYGLKLPPFLIPVITIPATFLFSEISRILVENPALRLRDWSCPVKTGHPARV